MRETTRRQYLGWLAYLEADYNNPSRSDFYLMQVASQVRLIYAWLAGIREDLPLEKFKIATTRDRPKAVDASASGWKRTRDAILGALGVKPPKQG